jgi:hypothetical protein
MAKLWCPICKISNFNTTTPTQAHVNAHLWSAHNHIVTPENEQFYRCMQDRKWEAAGEVLDEKLRQNTRDRQAEWEAFAAKPKEKNVPTTGMDQRLEREMVVLNEVWDDSGSSENETEELEDDEEDVQQDMISGDDRLHANRDETTSVRDPLPGRLQALEKDKGKEVLQQKRIEMRKALDVFEQKGSVANFEDLDDDDDLGNDADGEDEDDDEDDDDVDERPKKRNRKQ